MERFSEIQVETMYDKIPLNTRSINAILTLRYNPFQTPIIPKLEHGDFLTTNHEPVSYTHLTLPTNREV